MNTSRNIANLLFVSSWVSVSTLNGQDSKKTLVDFFLPAEPIGEMVSEGIWGEPGVLPRDIKNGLEDPTMEKWCYWDGSIVRDDEGKYHLYGSHWDQKVHHDTGWRIESKGIHAVSDHLMGPYIDKGEMWPDWKDGKGHNVIGLRMHDGRYAAVTSEITRGEVFISDKPEGPFELAGDIEIDYNGFHSGLARYHWDERHMANVMIWPREDGRYMLIGRSCAIMISEENITGPYKIMTEQVWKGIEGVPQDFMEDPTIWYSDGLYHVVVNHYKTTDLTFHLTSEDGIHNWKNRGIAMTKGNGGIFHYTDGTTNLWDNIQRPTVYVEDGEVKLFNFSAIDVHKGKDDGNDNHGSKIVLVPFDGKAFGKHMRALIAEEDAAADATPAPSPWQSKDLGAIGERGNTGYDSIVDTIRIKAGGTLDNSSSDNLRYVYQKVEGDVMLTTLVLSQDIEGSMATAGVMLRQNLDNDSKQVSALLSPKRFVKHRARTQAKSTASVFSTKKIRAPYYLRLVKNGDQVTTFISQTNKYNWEKLGSTKISLDQEYYVGIAAASDDGGLSLARFKGTEVHPLGTKDQILSHDLSDVIPVSGKVKVRVSYETSEPRDLILGMQNTQNWQGVPKALRRQVNGYGEIEFEYAPEESLDAKSTYQYIMNLVERGKDWKTSKDTDTVIIEKMTP